METMFCISYSLILLIFTMFVLATSRTPCLRRVWAISNDMYNLAIEVHRAGYAYIVTINGMNQHVFNTLTDAIAHAEESYDLHSAVYNTWGKNIGGK